MRSRLKRERVREPMLCSWPQCYMFVVLGNSSSFPSQDEPSGLFLSHQLLKLQPNYLSPTIWVPYHGLKCSSNNDNLLPTVNLRGRGVVFHVLSCLSIWSRVSFSLCICAPVCINLFVSHLVTRPKDAQGTRNPVFAHLN